MGLLSNRKQKTIDKYIEDLNLSSKSIGKNDIKWKVILEKTTQEGSFDYEHYFRTKKEAIDFAHLKKDDNTRIEVWKLELIM